ncbi:Os04g0184900 [Oryza sativa Japonica Group]|uniref:Os04g0184900 protein n=1 Tax=Oryza sativa subsp. japonica TaxID=39947 RepID=A0A0P0W7I4_ORYSJ|nr:hypothetical protein EE612_022347 [Oryza sativa]BAS87994.1 Os04g0184900 [Oryza sativa Japonica Group]
MPPMAKMVEASELGVTIASNWCFFISFSNTSVDISLSILSTVFSLGPMPLVFWESVRKLCPKSLSLSCNEDVHC